MAATLGQVSFILIHSAYLKPFIKTLHNIAVSKLLISLHKISVSEDTLFNHRDELKKLQNNTYIKLPVYVLDIKGFYPYVNELVNNVLKFKNIHMHRATTIMNRLNPKLNNVMVSIHIRLTDFAKHLKKLWNMTYASDEYFERAMQYFHSKYEVRFVIMRNFDQARL